MDTSRVDAYADALFTVAQAEGALAEVEDELYRFARVLEGNDELREVLTDQSMPAERRKGVVADLLGDEASSVTANLVTFIVGAGRARELPAIVDRLVERAATDRNKVVAQVRSAIPLDDSQRARLAESLGAATGKSVEVKVLIDPEVLGGIIAQVGDTVIDGSVRTRLDQLRETLR